MLTLGPSEGHDSLEGRLLGSNNIYNFACPFLTYFNTICQAFPLYLAWALSFSRILRVMPAAHPFATSLVIHARALKPMSQENVPPVNKSLIIQSYVPDHLIVNL